MTRENGIFPGTPWEDFLWRGPVRSRHRRHAISAFCALYWKPVFNLLRSRRVDPTEAEDLTQGFLLHFIESNAIARADPTKGRFRDFLSVALNHYLSHYEARRQSRKRGGGAFVLSLDEPGLGDLPECAARFGTSLPGDRAWAAQVLASVHEKLEMEYAAEGRGEMFRLLRCCLTGEEALDYSKLARRLRRGPVTLRTDVKRLRQQFREKLREELRHRFGASRADQELEILREILRGS